MKVNIFNIQHFSLNDGPGIRTTVFFKGCPLNCKWCHNPESKSIKKQLSYYKDKCKNCKECMMVCDKSVHTFVDGNHSVNRELCIHCGKCADKCMYSALEIVGKLMSVDEIMIEVNKDSAFYENGGGVTFSGGEPFYQFDALFELLLECKKAGYSTCIETSGYVKPEYLIKAIKYTDCFLYDYKETVGVKHKEFTGVDNDLILKNIELLTKYNANIILRCPIIPGLNEREDHFIGIANVAERFDCVKSVDILPYHPLGISKAKQLGMNILYENNAFLEKDKAEKYIDIIKKNTNKPVKIG